MIADRRAGGPEKQDLLSLLLRARDEDNGGAMDDRQLRDESLTLFTAGHETTANALTFSLYLLATHASAQQALHEELMKVLGSRPPGLQDVERLAFTRAVLSESMRLYPPAWAIGRQATDEVEVGGVPPAEGCGSSDEPVGRASPGEMVAAGTAVPSGTLARCRRDRQPPALGLLPVRRWARANALANHSPGWKRSSSSPQFAGTGVSSLHPMHPSGCDRP